MGCSAELQNPDFLETSVEAACLLVPCICMVGERGVDKMHLFVSHSSSL